MSILRAHVVEPKRFEEVARRLWTPFLDPEKITDTTFQAHPDAFRFEPQGARLHIAVAPLPQMLSMLHVPQTEGDINGLGIIFAVGPMALRDTPHPHGPDVYPPEDVTIATQLDLGAELLYRQVMLKKYTGSPLAFDPIRGTDFFDHIITCSARDILAIDFPENRPVDGAVDGLGNMLGRQLEG